MDEKSPSFLAIAPVFRVSDLARSLAFYCDRLGFAVDFEYGGFYAGVSRDGCRLHLKCSPPMPRDQAAFERDEHIDASVEVRDAAALCADLAQAVVPFR